MKLVFFGTPKFVLPVLIGLDKTFKTKNGSPIAAVVTQKPKPVGRKKKLTFSPVDKWAHNKNIPVFHSASELISSGIKADVGILAAYGEIVSKTAIDYFPKGIINIHGSILPKLRGASPVRAAIISGGKKTGATIMKLDEKLDHGPIISKFEVEIKKIDTAESLRDRVFEISSDVLNELLPAYLKEKIIPKPQDHGLASFTREITKQDGFVPGKYLKNAIEGKSGKEKWKIDFMKNFSTTPTAKTINNFTRAMDPWPGAWTEVYVTKNKKKEFKKRLKILKTHLDESEKKKLVLDMVQLEGKNPVTWEQFVSGYPDYSF